MTGGQAYHVGHLNVALLRDEWDSPAVAGFVDAVDQVNAIAERSDGFIINVGGDDIDAQIEAYDHPLTNNSRFAATLSVWESAQALDQFVHKTLHGSFLRRKDEWFEEIEKPSYVVWPIKAGHIPTLSEGMEKLALLAQNGPSADAFDLAWARQAEGAIA